ncbi:MAG: TnpV protein [Azonexus sp.]|nr:TnpV protein [Azonexus sp.]MBP8168183.1 TnpV protein [Azonexus sp.]
MQTYDLVKAALKDKNPALYKSLAASGELNQFVMERADEIDSEIVTLMMELSSEARKSAPGPMEVAQLLKGYHSMATEIVLAEMLEFPQDDEIPEPEEPERVDPFYQLMRELREIGNDIAELRESQKDDPANG